MGARETAENATLEIQRADLAQARIQGEHPEPLQPGQLQLRIERFALTANNITYGVIGEMLGYWEFFPSPEAAAGWGRIPAMGWAEVVASEVEGIKPGGRYYGWYPMARLCTLEASETADGFRDVSSHRAEHAPVYRSFVRTDLDPLHRPDPDDEDRQALLRGLFATGYLADEFFADSDYFGARQAIVLSASSKTAIAYAQCAARRGSVELIGVTSPPNKSFVESLGLYSRVLSYGEEGEIPHADSVAIDMAGNGEVLDRVHTHLADRLNHSMIVGMSHHDAERGQPSAGPDPETFFAPAEVKKRTEELGRERYQRQLAEALEEFIEGSKDWLEVVRSSGPDEALAAYREVLGGAVPPSQGRIVSLG